MITIRLTTWVNAPVERCFLLAANAELAGGRSSRSKAMQLQCGDQICWPLGRRSYSSQVDTVRPHSHIRELMSGGIFRYYEHDHHFATMDDGTRVRDEIRFSPKYGWLGRLWGATVLRMRLKKMLAQQNLKLKRIAEGHDWSQYVVEETGSEGVAGERIKIADPPSRATNMQRFA
ncbi:MAG TPA: hypothetical protein VL495_09115 [Edaphobacter sp.]|nr:hypothetical protein [Edaphobacter sp.]